MQLLMIISKFLDILYAGLTKFLPLECFDVCQSMEKIFVEVYGSEEYKGYRCSNFLVNCFDPLECIDV